MKELPADHAARHRATTEHDGALAVEAGAGTGKTTLLVARVLDGLERGLYRMQEVAAITFTRKAAAELRARLREGLARRLELAGKEEALRLREAQRMLPLAQISTIHSFCHALLNEFPLAAGLDPEFRVAEQGRSKDLLEGLWQQWLQEQLRDPQRARPFEGLLAWGVHLSDLRSLARDMEETLDLKLPVRDKEKRDDEAMWQSVRGRIASLHTRLLSARLDPEGRDHLLDAFAALREQVEGLAALSATARLRWLIERGGGRGISLSPVTLGKGRRSRFAEGVLDEVRDELRRWRNEELPADLRAHFRPLIEELLAALVLFGRWAREARVERGLITHNDLLVLTRDLLRDQPELRRLVAARYRALLVDEYQDTDPAQAQIVRMLRAEKNGPAVFLVGDPKQSIYRFRAADLPTYQQDVGELAANARLEEIRVNFRSSPELLEQIGTIGREIFAPEHYSAGQATWQDLLPAPQRARGALPAMVLAPFAQEERLNTEDGARAAATLLARECQRAHDEGVSWSEMAVLFPVASRAHLIEEAMDARGVPFRQEKSQRFYHQAEIAELAAVVSAVADPWDELKVVAALRSRLFGVSDEVLIRHRQAGGGLQAVRPPGGWSSARCGEAAVLEALDTLAGWAQTASFVPPPELIERILDETRFLLLLAFVPQGERAAANVRKLLDQAQAFWRDGGYSVADYAAWLLGQFEGKPTREAESPSAEEEDRVSLLTIHAAKGLEWRVVGLFALEHNPANRLPMGLHNRSTGCYEVHLGSYLETAGYGEARDVDQALEIAERARLLYVAMTRASERLILPFPTTGKSRAGSLLAQLRRSTCWVRWEAQAGAGKDPSPPAVVLAKEERLSRSDVTPTRGFHSSSHELPGEKSLSFGDATPELVSGAERLRSEWIEQREELLEMADCSVVVTPSSLHGPLPLAHPEIKRGQDIGSAVHKALEWWLLSGGRDEIALLAVRASGRERLDGVEAERVAECSQRATQSDLLARALASGCARAEWPFAWRTKVAGLALELRQALVARLSREGRRPLARGARVLVEGVVDLVFRDEGGLVLVDYKTDAWRSEEELEALAVSYRTQLAAYAAALASSGSGAVAELWLLFVGGPETRARKIIPE